MRTRYAYSAGLAILMAMMSYGCGKGDAIGSCDSVNDCPNVYTYVCRNGGCTLADDPSCQDGKKNKTETDVDCGGACTPCADNLSCSNNSDCMSGFCEKGKCSKKQCNSQKDCKGGNGVIMHGCGDDGVCMTCSDGKKNGDESAKDCGGSCDPCDDGASCNAADDCKSGKCSDKNICDPMGCKSTADCPSVEGASCVDGACISCKDNKKNGSETDVDCGGSCSPCASGKACSENSDCNSGVCASGRCEDKPALPATCSNSKEDGDETDEDCGGSCNPCGQEKKCKQDSDCKSWECIATDNSGIMICNGDGCEDATDEASILINEVFTRPDENAKMMHSDSNQMKFVELYNKTDKRLNLSNLVLTVKSGDSIADIPLIGCLPSKQFLVLHPTGKDLIALDEDASEQAVSLDAIGTNEMVIHLTRKDTSAIIDKVKVKATSGDEYKGISAGRGATSTVEDAYEVFVPHNTIPVTNIPAGESAPQNLYSPGVPNTLGFPQG